MRTTTNVTTPARTLGSKLLRRVPNELRPMVREALGKAQSARMTGHQHLRLVGPHGVVIVPSTPSDVRTGKNLRAELRRAGLLAA